jgi:hypothetical protein
MHTVIVMAGGFVLLGLCAFGGHWLGGAGGIAAGALVFLPLWLIGAGINLYVGVRQAGYTVVEEMPIFLLVFAIPAAVALFTWWKLR